jgi:tRNA1(Val) A37 N6-methylase TrmN6
MRDVEDAVAAWTATALSLTRAGGTVTAIVRADRAAEVLDARAGDMAVLFPLFPHTGESPKRVIIQIAKDCPGPQREAEGLVLHESDGRNTEACEAVLRHAAPILLTAREG